MISEDEGAAMYHEYAMRELHDTSSEPNQLTQPKAELAELAKPSWEPNCCDKCSDRCDKCYKCCFDINTDGCLDCCGAITEWIFGTGSDET